MVGRTDQWPLTIVLPVLLTKLLLIPVAMLFSLAASDVEVSAAFEDYSGTIRNIDAALVIVSLVVAPLLETLISAVLVWLLGFKLHMPASLTACAVALIFVPLHGLTPASLIVLPAFLIWALIQYNWMARGDGETGFKIVVASHALANLTALGASSLMGILS